MESIEASGNKYWSPRLWFPL